MVGITIISFHGSAILLEWVIRGVASDSISGVPCFSTRDFRRVIVFNTDDILKKIYLPTYYQFIPSSLQVWAKSVTKELLKWALFSSSYTTMPVLYGLVKKIGETFPETSFEELQLKKKDLMRKFKVRRS